MKIKIIFVCLGNICRSPMAEGAFTHHVNKKNLNQYFEIESAGTAAYHIGKLPDERMRKTAQNHSINLATKAKKISSNEIEYFDYIVAMDEQNLTNLKSITPTSNHHKIFLLRDYDHIKTSKNVPDPYYGNMEDFENVFEIVYRTTEQLLKKIIDKHLLK